MRCSVCGYERFSVILRAFFILFASCVYLALSSLKNNNNAYFIIIMCSVSMSYHELDKFLVHSMPIFINNNFMNMFYVLEQVL